MAKVNDALRTCGLLSLFLVNLCESSVLKYLPSIESYSVIDKSCSINSNGNNYCKYLLNVTGGEFLGHVSWSITPAGGVKGDDCVVKLDDFHFKEIETLKWSSSVEVTVPASLAGKLYICLYLARDYERPLRRSWIHQGDAVTLEPIVDILNSEKSRIKSGPGDGSASLKAAPTSLTGDPSGDSGSGLDKTEHVWVDLSQDTNVNYRRQSHDHFAPQELDNFGAAKGVRRKGGSGDDFGTRMLAQDTNSLQNVDTVRRVEVETRPEYVGSPEVLDGEYYNTLMYGAASNNRRDIVKRSNADASYVAPKSIKEVVFKASTEKEISKESVSRDKIVNVDKSIDNTEIESKKVGYADSGVILEKSLPKNLNKITSEDNNLASEVVGKYVNSNGVSYLDEKILDKNEGVIAISGLKAKGDYNIDVDTDDFEKDHSSEHVNLFAKGDDGTPPKYANSVVETDSDSIGEHDPKVRVKRGEFTSVRSEQPYKDVEGRNGDEAGGVKIVGFRVEAASKPPDIGDDGVPSLLTELQATLRLFGSGFTENTAMVFTHKPGKYGDPCLFPNSDVFPITRGATNGTTVTVTVTVPSLSDGRHLFYMCTKSAGHSASAPFVHQGDEPWLLLAVHDKILPLWASIVVIITCLTFSALFSGLNLGLMSMDKTELKIIANTGTPAERKYALAIMPVRNHGNFLLCSILLGNVAVNSSFTLLLDDLTSGLVAVVCSTLAIVLLGEITPQAVCSRYGLAVGAKTIMITKVVMVLTSPISWPVSKVLDILLGEEIGNVYNRERLKELVTMTTDQNDLDKDEVNIISGALELRKKTVSEVMTKIEDIYMLSIEAVLDFETVTEIMNTGYSRIPVYEGQRHNIVTVLFIKDLAFVDPSDNRALKTLCQFYQNPCNFVFEDTTLDVMFRQFKEGHKGHMAFVHRVNNEGEGDPFYETVGLVTLEDVIEELIQAEIVDETDVYTDNKSKRRRNRPTNRLQNFAEFAEKRENQRIHISPQLTLATFQFLSTTIDAFKDELVSENVLRRLLRQDIIRQIRCKGKDKNDPTTLIYQEGKAVDYFALILEGRVEVTVGRENLIFEAGPFTYFGIQALMQNIGVGEATPTTMGSLQNINMDSMLRYTFIPDYSVRAITDLYYITIRRALYLAAKRATLMEKSSDEHRGSAHFDSEVEKLFHQLDDDKSLRDAKSPSRQVSPQPLPASASPYTRSTFNSPSSGPLPPMVEDSTRNGDVAYKFRPADQTVEQVESESTALLDKKP